MKQALLSFGVFCSLFLVVVACGRLNDKFGRAKSDYTRVQFRSEQSLSITSQDGGMMIYFARNGAGGNSGGVVYAFPNEIAAAGTPVSVPNGSYKVFALSYDGDASGKKLEGQARCAIGNDGGDVNLVGTSATVTLNLGAGHCNFNGFGPFSSPLAADAAGGTNFDMVNVRLCSNSPSSCTTASANNRVQVTMLAGEKPGGGGPMILAGSQPVKSGCAVISSGVATTAWRIPVGPSSGPGVGPPFRVDIYSSGDLNCTGAVVSSYEVDGMDKYYNADSASNIYVDSPSSSNYTTLMLFKNF